MAEHLYAFDLPDDILSSLELRADLLVAPAVPTNETTLSTKSDAETTSLGCSTCRVASFGTVAGQRSHFKSDWHRYNIRAKSPISEEAFDALQEREEVGSISGSEASTSSEESESESSESDEAKLITKPKNSPLAWFTANKVQTTQYGIYKALLGNQTLQQLQLTPIYPPKQQIKPSTEPESRTWAIFMIGGGHFAGAIYSLVPKYVKVSGKLERQSIVLESKTFHRYTTRRKQGGSQSTNDQSKSKAKSAGAQIRRYNEQALQEDIRELLEKWQDQLKQCERVFIRASKANSKIFHNYEKTPLERSDPRIKTIPFPTRRPTLSELQRVFEELTTVKVSHLTQDMLDQLLQEALDAQAKAQLRISALKTSKAIAVKDDTAPQVSDAEMAIRAKWQRVLGMVARQKLDTLISFLDKQAMAETPIDFVKSPLPADLDTSRTTPTLLHYASMQGAAEIVRYLLIDHHCDPTVLSPIGNKTAYELASTRATRNVFRRLMADLPTLFDWEASRVPSGLTEEQEVAQKSKDAERKSKLREKAREREAAARKAEEEERARSEAAFAAKKAAEAQAKLQSANGPQRLGGVGASVLRAQQHRTEAGLTEAQKMRLERERRARAAEARLRQ